MAPSLAGQNGGAEPLAFRPEIEGLRAIAILPVVLIHAGFSQFPGGFVGVDVFFVISGYLITRILMADVDPSGAGLARFYARRFARIGPALWAMIAVVLAVGVWLLLPSDWPALSMSAIFAAGFAGNLHFWQTTDYFATHETALLLHTWSLGVEEQFYLFYPLLFVVLRRWMPGREATGLLVLFALSLMLCLWLSISASPSAFYLFSSRAWELALGGLLALGVGARAGVRIEGAVLRGGLALMGLALIAVSVLWIDQMGAFPAPAALVTCVGAALVIAYGAQGPAHWALTRAPMRWIGRISYSTYLWHWPIFVFWRLEHGVELDRWSRVGLVAAALLAGAVSYCAIERPAQRGLLARSHRRTFRIAIASVAALVALALAGGVWGPKLTSGPAAQMAVTLAARADQRRVEQYRMGTCFGAEIDFETCVRPVQGAQNIVLMGSSYAAMLWRAMDEASGPEIRVHQATVLGCNPVLGPIPGKLRESACERTYARVFALARAGEIDTLILASRWHARDAAALSNTVTVMRDVGVRVVVIGPPVEYEQSFPRVLAIAERRRDPLYVNRMRRSERDAIDRPLRTAVEDVGGRYISHWRFECPRGRARFRCRHIASDGLPIHYDTGHLTPVAARDFVRSEVFP